MIGFAFGEVRHARLRPTRYAFRHAALWLRVSLDELERPRRTGPLGLLGIDRAAPISMRAADHGDGRRPLRAWLRETLAQAGLPAALADGRVVLHAFPRMLGHAFKPVSFWHFQRDDGSVAAVIAEVNSTFGERHCYVLGHADGSPIRDGQTLAAGKRMHVSPFCDVSGGYRFRFAFGPRRTLARVELHDAHGPLLLTSLSGEETGADARACLRALFGHPMFTLGVVARIHVHALRLWLRGVPFFRKPADPPALPVTRGL